MTRFYSSGLKFQQLCACIFFGSGSNCIFTSLRLSKCQSDAGCMWAVQLTNSSQFGSQILRRDRAHARVCFWTCTWGLRSRIPERSQEEIFMTGLSFLIIECNSLPEPCFLRRAYAQILITTAYVSGSADFLISYLHMDHFLPTSHTYMYSVQRRIVNTGLGSTGPSLPCQWDFPFFTNGLKIQCQGNQRLG